MGPPQSIPPFSRWAIASLALTLCGAASIPASLFLPCLFAPLSLAVLAAPVPAVVGICGDPRKWQSALALAVWAAVCASITWGAMSMYRGFAAKPKALGISFAEYAKLLMDSQEIASDPATFVNRAAGATFPSTRLDPWGQPYIITLKTPRSASDIVTSGRDLTPGTADDINLVTIDRQGLFELPPERISPREPEDQSSD